MTYISPLAEMFGSVPLEFLVPFVAHDRWPAPGQASLGDIYVVALHPLWPIAAVTAMDKTGTFKEEGSPCHDWSFLEEPESRIKDVTIIFYWWQPKVTCLHWCIMWKKYKECLLKHTRSRAAARMDASGMVPGSQQFSRNWKRFMPCRIAPKFTTFLFFMASWLAARRSWKPWGPEGRYEYRTREKRRREERKRGEYNRTSEENSCENKHIWV